MFFSGKKYLTASTRQPFYIIHQMMPSFYAERISQLANQFNSLNVVACAKSMADLATSGDPIQLMKSIMITPSAAQQVAKRMSEGWIYLKL